MGEQIMKDLLTGPLHSHYIDNYKPSWLGGLEIDRYYPALRMAFEFQGDQHTQFSFIKHKNHEDFISQWRRDEQKRSVLLKKKICLVEYNAKELTPTIFSRKLSDVLFEPVDLDISESYINNIKKYQNGLDIHFKREIKSLFVSSGYYNFVRIKQVDDAIDRFFSLPGIDVSLDEKRCLCILSLLSRENQVLLNSNQIAKTIPNLHLSEYLRSLIDKKLISYDSSFKLITLRSDVFTRCHRFIQALLLFVENRDNKGSLYPQGE